MEKVKSLKFKGEGSYSILPDSVSFVTIDQGKFIYIAPIILKAFQNALHRQATF